MQSLLRRREDAAAAKGEPPAHCENAGTLTSGTPANGTSSVEPDARLGTAPSSSPNRDGRPARLRHDGFLEGFGITNGSPEIVAQENTNGDQTKAQTAMENILQRAPRINALYTINEPAAAGAYQAIQSANRAGQITIGYANDGNLGFGWVERCSGSRLRAVSDSV